MELDVWAGTELTGLLRDLGSGPSPVSESYSDDDISSAGTALAHRRAE